MLLRLFQITKAVCYMVTLALLLQPGGLGCALACARTSSITNQHECHVSTSNSAPSTHVTNAAILVEHACCHSSTSEHREAVSPQPIKIFHHVAEMMPCCVLAIQMVIPAVKQRTTADKTSVPTKEKVSTPLSVEFRDVPLIKQGRLPDRGRTFLRCCVLLI
jgi:hypothetical protein